MSRKLPYYGKLGTATLNKEVHKIWLTRDAELPELPQKGWSWEQQTDPEMDVVCDLARRIVETTPLTDREQIAISMCVIENATLDDLGEVLGCTRERARQITLKGLRRLRTHQQKLTGISAYGNTFEF